MFDIVRHCTGGSERVARRCHLGGSVSRRTLPRREPVTAPLTPARSCPRTSSGGSPPGRGSPTWTHRPVPHQWTRSPDPPGNRLRMSRRRRSNCPRHRRCSWAVTASSTGWWPACRATTPSGCSPVKAAPASRPWRSCRRTGPARAAVRPRPSPGRRWPRSAAVGSRFDERQSRRVADTATAHAFEVVGVRSTRWRDHLRPEHAALRPGPHRHNERST